MSTIRRQLIYVALNRAVSAYNLVPANKFDKIQISKKNDRHRKMIEQALQNYILNFL